MPAISRAQAVVPDAPPDIAPSRAHTEAAGSSSASPRDAGGSLILRIKRKRGTDPISALRIETLLSEGVDPEEVEKHAQAMQAGQAGSPDDKLDVSSLRMKRRLTTRGVFRLAETVSLSSFADEMSTSKMERHLDELKRQYRSPLTSPRLAQEASSSTQVQEPQLTQEEAKAKDAEQVPSALRFKVVKPWSKTKSGGGLKGTLTGQSSTESLRARAAHSKLIRTGSASSLSSLRRGLRQSGAPPGKSKLAHRVRFIDAVIESSSDDKPGDHDQVGQQARTSTATSSNDVEMESLDRRFADLLGNYLKESDLEPPADLYDSTRVVPDENRLRESADDSDDDYVYDIYFREKETMWGFGPAGASDVGLQPAEVAGHGDEQLGAAAAYNAGDVSRDREPMATLVGFNDEDDLISEMMNASKQLAEEVPYDSDDDFDEGEDEDSNDEGFYRNDYPEDEGEEEGETEQSVWGWSGPRRVGQRRSSDDSDEDGDDDNESGSDDLHH